MAESIFFDLETTDLCPTGQILNYCFIAVGEDWKPGEECSGRIRVSRLQLPTAGAIAATKTDILKHQEEAEETEPQAMERIHRFLSGRVKTSGRSESNLIGYNSARFDLHFLRTNMIRNGFNPYFKLRHRDLYFAAKKLALSNPDFRALVGFDRSDGEKPSLKLENLCTLHGLMTGDQAHESREDVLLTIRLAKEFAERYGLDVRSYDSYEAKPFHGLPKGTVLAACESPKAGEPNLRYRTLLSYNHRMALWIDIERYREAEKKGEDLKEAVRWFNYDRTPFFTSGEPVEDESLLHDAHHALGALSKVHVDNYFEPTECDIEAHIYRISPGRIDELRQIFRGEEPAKDLPPDEHALALRYRLANLEGRAVENEEAAKALREYALYRYGGSMPLAKQPEESPEKGRWCDEYHPNYQDLLYQLSEIIEESPELAPLMNTLKRFYEESELVAVAGKALMEIPRREKTEKEQKDEGPSAQLEGEG